MDNIFLRNTFPKSYFHVSTAASNPAHNSEVWTGALWQKDWAFLTIAIICIHYEDYVYVGACVQYMSKSFAVIACLGCAYKK